MRKSFLPILIFICCQSAFSQKKFDYKPAVSSFYKISPFDREPDSLFRELTGDPDLLVDTIIYPTDTTLFYLRGYYKTFNPFSSAIKKVELLYFQSNVIRDNIKGKDRILTYMITGITDSTENGRRAAVAEEKKIFDGLYDLFTAWAYKKSGRKDSYRGANHYYKTGSVVPVFSGWGIWYKTKKDYCVSVNTTISFLAEADKIIKSFKIK